MVILRTLLLLLLALKFVFSVYVSITRYNGIKINQNDTYKINIKVLIVLISDNIIIIVWYFNIALFCRIQ